MHETGGGSGQETITVHACGSASGDRIPPYIVYKGKHLYSSWTRNGPDGAMYSTSPSGWMVEINFLLWMKKIFIPTVTPYLSTGPVILFLDGHYSHIGIDLIKLCREKNVWLYCLPPNTTHVLQPLDVAVFGPVKAAWRSIVKTYKVGRRAATITKEVFPSLLTKLWSCSIKPHHLPSFRECGLFPLDRTAIRAYKLAPSLPVTAADTVLPSASAGTETPLRTELRHFFVRHLQPKQGPQKSRCQRVMIHHAEEALTNDEVIQRIEATTKKQTTKGKTKKSISKKNQSVPVATVSDDEETDKDTEHCFSCGQYFNDCLGCDNCWRWYDYYCVGFNRMISANQEWSCPLCV